ncbi:hypothetical protein U1Q18_008095, partial [Sarracenia purpurea var. burkii]
YPESNATVVAMQDVLKDVWHVPNLWLNFISQNALDWLGFKINFENWLLKLTKGSLVIAKA